jgi:hypothetical protein
MYPENGGESRGTFSNRRPYHHYDPLPRIGSCGGADSVGNAPIGIAAPHSAAPSNSARPSAGPIAITSPGSVQLTNSDNRRTVFAPVGSVIEIRLVEETPGYAWQIPQSTTTVTSTLSGQRSPDGGAQAGFAIRRTGETSLTTTNDCQGAGCEVFSEIWRVNLVVRA